MYKLVKNKVKVFLFMGQSNEDGGTNAITHSLQYRGYNNSFIFWKPDNSTTNNGDIYSYKFGVNNNTNNLLNFVCPQTSFGKHLYDQSKETIYMIKYSKGGSALVDRGTPYSNGNWEVNASPANGTRHYHIGLNNFFIPAINLMKKRKIDFEIVAAFWCQGESDSILENSAINYEAKLIQLFDRLKQDLSPYNVLSPNFKPIITRIHNNFTPGTRPFMNEVRQALENVANHYDSYWIDSDGYGLHTDNTHYNYLGQEQHGVDRANIILNHFF